MEGRKAEPPRGPGGTQGRGPTLFLSQASVAGQSAGAAGTQGPDQQRLVLGGPGGARAAGARSRQPDRPPGESRPASRGDPREAARGELGRARDEAPRGSQPGAAGGTWGASTTAAPKPQPFGTQGVLVRRGRGDLGSQIGNLHRNADSKDTQGVLDQLRLVPGGPGNPWGVLAGGPGGPREWTGQKRRCQRRAQTGGGNSGEPPQSTTRCDQGRGSKGQNCPPPPSD